MPDVAASEPDALLTHMRAVLERKATPATTYLLLRIRPRRVDCPDRLHPFGATIFRGNRRGRRDVGR